MRVVQASFRTCCGARPSSARGTTRFSAKPWTEGTFNVCNHVLRISVWHDDAGRWHLKGSEALNHRPRFLERVGKERCFPSFNLGCSPKTATSQSRAFSFAAGVRRGCVLSPPLFHATLEETLEIWRCFVDGHEFDSGNGGTFVKSAFCK